MNRTQLLQRLYALKKNPTLYKELSNEELAEFVRVVLTQVDSIEKAIKEGRLDGYTPQPGKDYLSRREGEDLLKTLFKGAVDKFGKEFSKEKGAIEQAVNKRLSELQNGKDGQNALITDEMLQDVAERAYELITMPNFESLITQEPGAIRDALELLQGDDRLDKSAIKGLDDLERELRDFSIQTVRSAGGVSKNTVAQMIADAPGGDGSGDMLASVYDPQGIEDDAFDVDNHTDGTTNKVYTATEKNKLAGIETGATADQTGAEIVSLIDTELGSTDWQGGAGGTDDQTASEVPFTPAGNIASTDVQSALEELDTEKAPALGADDNYVTDAEKTKLSNISVTQAVDLDALETASHDALTVTDSAEIDLQLTGQDLTASLKAGSIDETKLDASVNASLDLADTSVQDLGDLGITATTTELNYVDGVTSAIQTQIDAKPTISSGAGAPASTPTKVGDIYIDTTNDNAYVAVGTASSADWEQTNDGAGVADGDKGDVTVSSSGTVWTLDATAISGKTTVTPAQTDTLLIGDASDSGNLKKATISNVVANVADGTIPIGKIAEITGPTVLGRQSSTGLVVELTPANARTTLGLVIGTDVQAYDADLTTWTGKTAPTGTVVGTTDTQTLEVKRVRQRVTSTTSASSLTPSLATADRYVYTALAVGFTLNNPSDMEIGEVFVLQVTDNSTPQSLAFGTDYVGIDGQALPTTTVDDKCMEIICSKVGASKILVSYVTEA